MKKNVKAALAILGAMFVLGMAACSNASGDGGSSGGSSSGGTNQTGTGGGSTSATYTITFNANDGSATPATATQTFTAETAQALKTISELGFSKSGSYFAGWLTSADASQVSYTDGSNYTATADATLYAFWSAIPVYKVNVATNENGTVTPSQTAGVAGTEITLSNSPAAGYKFVSYTVTAEDGSPVALTENKFKMPAQNVTVTAAFNAINYTVICGTFANGSVTASPSTATIGTTVSLTVSPVGGYGLAMLSVIDEDGASVSLRGTGYSRTFTMPAKNVTVAATFATAASGAYTKIGTAAINGTQYDLVTFGLWPQTIKAADVEVSEQCESTTAGGLTYYKGSDGQWYVKIKEKPYDEYKYSDGTAVAKRIAGSYKWFKVEPIKWRVLTADYNGTGKKLLLAESILVNCAYHDYNVNRTVGGNTVYPNNWEHSKVRAFLNGLSYQKKISDSAAQVACDDFLEKGFLQTAFAVDELAIIKDTSVDNSARSTNPDANAKLWGSGKNSYANSNPITDKVFFLSEQEVTTSTYGFDVHSANGVGNKRIRQTTDYAIASGNNTWQCTTDGWGGSWWLRSPDYMNGDSSRFVAISGGATIGHAATIWQDYIGVVPALCVSN